MIFQPADELYSALGEALDALLENSQSASAIAFGLGIALGECCACFRFRCPNKRRQK